MWIEALNQARVEASSVLRKVDRVYYPPTIREFVLSGSRTDTTFEVAAAGKDSTTNISTSSDRSIEEAEQPRVIEKYKNTNQEAAPGAMKPPTVTQDPPAEKEASKNIEVVLATLSLLAKADPTSKGPEASKATST